MPLTRVQIDQIQGVARNPVEGGTAPRELLNLTFDRAGGVTPFGDWMSTLSTEATSASVLAHDEGTMVLFDTPAVWTNTLALIELGTAFEQSASLTLIPRSGVVTPIDALPAAGADKGLVFVREAPQGRYFTYQGAAAVTTGAIVTAIETGVTHSVPSGTYQFAWAMEAPTDAGLLTYGIGLQQKALTVTAGYKVKLTTADAVPEGHVVRWYYRVDQPGFTRFATKVGDGGTMVAELKEATLDLVSDGWLATEDAIMNFAPGRAEVHEGRVWGAATENPFVPYLPASAQERTDAYFTRSLAETKSTIAFYSDTGSTPLQTVGDKLTINVDQLLVRRASDGADVIVPLVTMRDATSASEHLSFALKFTAGGADKEDLPKVYLMMGTTTLDFVVVQTALTNVPTLGYTANSEVVIEDMQVLVTIAGLTSELDVDAVVTVGALAEGYDLTIPEASLWPGVASAVVRPFCRVGGAFNQGLFAYYGESWSVRFTRLLAETSVPATEFDMDIMNYVSGTSFSSGGDTWTLAASGNAVTAYSPVEVGEALTVSKPEMTVVYSNPGAANRGWQANVITLNASSSSRITALSSTPAGLLVFMENETWLISGNPDPYAGDVRVQRFSGTMGCDPGVTPARLGAVVFPIYNGELYAISLGMGDVDFGSGVENIGRPIWLREDPFVRAVGEPRTNHVVAATRSGIVYRYDAQAKAWFNDPFSDVAVGGEGDILGFYEYVLQENGDNVLFEDGYQMLGESSPSFERLIPLPYAGGMTVYLVNNEFWGITTDEAGDVRMRWDDLDFGDRYTHKLWRRVEVSTSGSYAGTPTLRYAVDGDWQSTVSGVSSGNGVWVFNLHRGQVGITLGLEFAFPGMQLTDSIEPPIVIEAAARYRSRGRVA